MTRVLNAIIIVSGAWTAFIGMWGLIESSSSSTTELQEMQLWISLALVSGGVGLITTGLARVIPIDESARHTTKSFTDDAFER